MGTRVGSWWQKIKTHPARTVLIAAILAVVIVLIILSTLGYIFHWDWTGLSPYVSPPHSKDSDFQRGKTLWDWLQLLIIPAVLAVAGYIINLTISRGEQAATEQRAKSEREAAEKRAETEYKIALDNQRETALKEYIDKMSELILHEDLLGSDPKKEVRETARIQTLTALPRLDPKRKESVLELLLVSNLIANERTIIYLGGADLSGVHLDKGYLGEINLHRTNLSKAYLDDVILLGADLGEADLSEASLIGTTLFMANLSKAKLLRADLHRADLQKADLSEADLSEANLQRVDLRDAKMTKAILRAADLHEADLRGADLTEVNLTDADLTKAKITQEQLKQTKSLKGATKPDGSIYP